MEPLDILTAQSIAAERMAALTQGLEHRRNAAERTVGITGAVGGRRRRHGLRARMHLAHPTAHHVAR